MIIRTYKHVFWLVVCTLMTTPVLGQTAPALFQEIARMDSLFFEALNGCDLPKYEAFLTEDYEGYHDKAGLTTPRDREMADMEIFCGEQRRRQPLRRALIAGTMEVYPLHNYGAIESGQQVFYLQINDGTEKLVGQARFTFVWKKEGDTWKLSRVLSYDHQPLGEIELDVQTLSLYEGNFKASDRIVNIKREGRILRVSDIKEGEVVWSAELLPEAEHLFYLHYENVQAEFVFEEGKLVKHVYYANGEFQEEVFKIEE
ncbi:MAG: nuclear transport factor 2 family protein [Bacteroidota bacterium]